ncbi:unnamed protein product [Penicillium bialowiezense]
MECINVDWGLVSLVAVVGSQTWCIQSETFEDKPSKVQSGNPSTDSVLINFSTGENVLTTPKDLKDFHSDSALHKKSPSSNGGWFFHQLLGDCMGLINDHHWQAIRSQFHGYFTHSSIARSSSFLLGFTRDYFQHFAAQLAIEVQPVTHFSSFPFFATAEYLYGPLSKAEKDELWALGQRNLALMGCVLMGGVYRSQVCRWSKPEAYRQLKSFEHDWAKFNKTIVQRRKELHGPSPPVVEAWKAVENGTVTRKEVWRNATQTQRFRQSLQHLDDPYIK